MLGLDWLGSFMIQAYFRRIHMESLEHNIAIFRHQFAPTGSFLARGHFSFRSFWIMPTWLLFDSPAAKTKNPSFGLSLLQNPTETLATQTTNLVFGTSSPTSLYFCCPSVGAFNGVQLYHFEGNPT